MPVSSSESIAVREPEPVEGGTLVPELAPLVVSVMVKVSVDAAGSESEACRSDRCHPLAFGATARPLGPHATATHLRGFALGTRFQAPVVPTNAVLEFATLPSIPEPVAAAPTSNLPV
jgi:hypothetical protein